MSFAGSEPCALLMGGKPIGSCEIAESLKKAGARLIVTDYLPAEDSPAKALADEVWDVSTADIDELEKRCKKAGVNAVFSGVHEFNIMKMLELSARLGLKSYCTEQQWENCCDKGQFKALCIEHGIDVAKRYALSDLEAIPEADYPIVVKPLDGSGSRGFSKCANAMEVQSAIEEAREYSLTGNVLVEQFIEADSVIIHYTVHEGRVIFSGIADKYSKKVGEDGAPVMALQIAPSIHQDNYLRDTNCKAIRALESIELAEGPVWIEACVRDGKFLFNEMGLRFGGSMTNHMVKELTGLDQLKLLISSSLGGKEEIDVDQPTNADGVYCIWPMHLLPGRISSIEGLSAVEEDPRFVASASVHGIGDQIEDWGSAQQVFRYFHFKADTVEQLLDALRCTLSALSVKDEDGQEMLYALFNPYNSELPDFAKARL